MTTTAPEQMYTKDQYWGVHSQYQFKDTMQEQFKQFTDLVDVSGLETEPEELVEVYHSLIEEEELDIDLDQELQIMRGIWGRFKTKELKQALGEYAQLHEGFAVLLREWQAQV